MLSVDYDDMSGIVSTKAHGLSANEEFDAYLPVLEGYLTRSRARHGKWLHLVDASHNPVQPKDAADHVAAMWNARPREDGYTAYILQSVLARMQIERMRDHPKKAFFSDAASARKWLLERVGGQERIATQSN